MRIGISGKGSTTRGKGSTTRGSITRRWSMVDGKIISGAVPPTDDVAGPAGGETMTLGQLKRRLAKAHKRGAKRGKKSEPETKEMFRFVRDSRLQLERRARGMLWPRNESAKGFCEAMMSLYSTEIRLLVISQGDLAPGTRKDIENGVASVIASFEKFRAALKESQE